MSGESLQELLRRKARGRTDTELAAATGLSLSTVNNLTTGRRSIGAGPSNDVILAFARGLPCRVSELWAAVGVSRGLDLEDRRSALEAGLPPGVHVLDDYPLLVEALQALIAETISTVTAVSRGNPSSGTPAGPAAKPGNLSSDRSADRVPQPSGPTP